VKPGPGPGKLIGNAESGVGEKANGKSELPGKGYARTGGFTVRRSVRQGME